MPNISSLTMPDGIVYNIKDSQARKDIEDMKKSGGGSGSGSSSGAAVYATFSTEDGGTSWTCDKTFEELKTAYDAGSLIFAITDYAPGNAALMRYRSAFSLHEENVVEDFLAEIITFDVKINATNTLKAYRFKVSNSHGVIVQEAEKSFTNSSGDDTIIQDPSDPSSK